MPSLSTSAVISPTASALVRKSAGGITRCWEAITTLPASFIWLRRVCVRTQLRPVGHIHRRMVGTKTAKKNIERHHLRPVLMQLPHDSPVNMTRPIQPILGPQKTIIHQVNGIVADINKAQFGGDHRGMFCRQSHPPVKSHSLQAFEKIMADGLDRTGKHDDRGCDPDGRLFKNANLHCDTVHKKTRATQGCSGL